MQRAPGRRPFLSIAVVALLVATPIGAFAADLEAVVRAMTFNIRYGTADDGPNRWQLRKQRVFATLREARADFLGLQEALPFQIDEIAAALPDHEVLYRTRQADPTEGEACPIFYRSDRWELDRRRHGTFWLSETPEEPGSKSWDSSLPRIATWGLFTQRETGARVVVFVTHFDHRGQEARERSASLLRERVRAEAAGLPVLVLGDFNAGETNQAMARLREPSGELALVDSFRVVHPDRADVFTANDWGRRTAGEKIDGIFVRAGADVVDAEILRPRLDGRAPSDHDPVTVTLRLLLEETSVEITDLGECRSCAGAIVRELERLDGVARAELHSTDPTIVVTTAAGAAPAAELLRAAVRQAGYTPGEVVGASGSGRRR